MEFTEGKIQRKKVLLQLNYQIRNSGIQIVTTQEEGELQHWDYYLRLVASAFCETVLLF